MIQRFAPSKPTLCYDECVTLFWDVEGVNTVAVNGQGVVGHGSMQVCSPGTFVLSVVCKDGTTKAAQATIGFDPQSASCGKP